MTDPQIQELMTAIDQADSSTRLIQAVRALAAARSVEGIPTLIQVLGYNNPGAAVTALQGLVQLGEVAVQPLLEQIDGYNYGARSYSIRALAAIADPRALETLLDASETDFAPSVRRAATKGVGCLDWHQLASEQMAQAQAKALKTLLLVSQDADWAIRYAAVVGLQALAQSLNQSLERDYSQSLERDRLRLILDRLTEMAQTDPALATQSRVRLALNQLSTANSQPPPVCC